LPRPENWRLPRNLAQLKAKLRKHRVLDDLAEVEVVMRSLNDTEGLEVAQNLELHMERLFALKPKDEELCREVLGAIRDARLEERVKGIKARWSSPESERVVRTLEVGGWALGPALEPILASLQPVETTEGVFDEAERVRRKKDYDGALKLYRSFVQRRPKDKRAVLAEHASAFILQKKLKKPAEARQAYQRIVKNHGELPIAYTAYFHIAETFETDGHTDSALEQYGSFLDLAPEHPRATAAERRVKALQRKKKGEKAEPTWGQVLLEKKKKSKKKR
jgi:tetratricopeptide (TPR) repeat protein